MKKLPKIIVTVLFAITVALSAVGCASLPNFINPEYSGNGGNNKYVISITSTGGLPLNGVRVTASKDGNELKSGISRNGKVELALALDEYDLTFSNLPAGYYIPEGSSYKTSAESYEFSAVFNSKVISTSATTGTLYGVGDVMHDFAVTDSDGVRLLLSELVENNKAVMLNFWFKSCGPCRSEFPAIEEAYKVYQDDLKIIALTNQDTLSDVQSYKDELDLTFYLGQDNGGITSLFGVTSFPTTVIIDRYGVVAYIESGSDSNPVFWKTLFGYYTADEYVQTPGEEDDGNEGDGLIEPTKPTEGLQMPESYLLAEAACDESFAALDPQFLPETNENDAPYSWPWKIGEENGESYIYATNTQVDNSYAILYITFTIDYGYALSFEYNVSTDDNVYIIYDNESIWECSEDSDGWKTHTLEVFARRTTVRLGVVYNKDTVTSAKVDFVKLRNFKITNALDLTTAIDVYRDCATDPSINSYTNYSDYVLGEDGYYHVVNADNSVGSIIFADLNSHHTAWTALRFGSNFIERDTEHNTEYYRTMWDFTFWKLNDASSENIVLNGTDHTDIIIDNYNMQGFSDNGYVPVYPALKNALQDFAIEYATRFPREGGEDDLDNENLWLEFCGYFDHYGSEAHPNGICFCAHDPVKGMSLYNAIVIEIPDKDEITDGEVVASGIANVNRPLSVKRGTRHKLTATKAGVYNIRSTYDNSIYDPHLFMYSDDGTYIGDMNDSRDYDRFTSNSGFNFSYYIYLEEGESCYPTFAMFPGETGEYPYEVKYLGETAEVLLLCSTGDGMFIQDEETGGYKYIAVEVVFDALKNQYVALDENGEEASPVYIDFLRPSFLTFTNAAGIQFNYTLEEMANNGMFNLTGRGGRDYTEDVKALVARSKEGKDASDPLYGMLIADKEVVAPINALLGQYQEGTEEEKGWLQMACYKQYFGPSEY